MIDKLKLYAITDRRWSKNDEEFFEQVEQVLKGGARCIQIREKDLDFKDLKFYAQKIQMLCKQYDALFIVNDYVELALEIEADGIHIGQEDMALEDVMAKINKKMIVGVSAGNIDEALKAQENGADYIGVGAVFKTDTKDNADYVTKYELAEICQKVSIPVVAIGGITKENIRELKGTGISSVAVISAIFAKDEPKRETEELLDLIDGIL